MGSPSPKPGRLKVPCFWRYGGRSDRFSESLGALGFPFLDRSGEEVKALTRVPLFSDLLMTLVGPGSTIVAGPSAHSAPLIPTTSKDVKFWAGSAVGVATTVEGCGGSRTESATLWMYMWK